MVDALTLESDGLGERQKRDRAGILVQFNFEFLARYKVKAFGIRVADQKVAVAMNACAEFGLTSSAASSCTAIAGGKLVTLGFHQGSVKTFAHQAATRADVTAAPGDLIFRAVAESPRLVQ